jgi:hypothetical protein
LSKPYENRQKLLLVPLGGVGTEAPAPHRTEVAALGDASSRAPDRLRKLGRVPRPVRIGRREYGRVEDLEFFPERLA